MGRRKITIFERISKTDLDTIIDSVYLDILTAIASGKANYTTKIAELLGKSPSTVSEEVEKLVRLSLVNVSEKTKTRQYEINWIKLVELILEHWRRIAHVFSKKLRDNKKLEDLLSQKIEEIKTNYHIIELIKSYFYKYSELKWNKVPILVPAYGIFFEEDTILTLSQQMLVDFTSQSTLKKMKRNLKGKKRKIYYFFLFFKNEILDITHIYEKAVDYAINKLSVDK